VQSAFWNAPESKSLSRDQFVRNLNDSGLWSQQEIDETLRDLAGAGAAPDGAALAQLLVAAGKLTGFEAEAIYQRRFAELVIGNYEVLDRLGVGAMGTVYKGRHRHLQRVVALKVLPRELGQTREMARRFQREVEAIARLNHPNIVMAYDADEAQVGRYLVMEFVNGRDLASEVVERGPLPVREAVDCVLQAARGLAYAHAQGIVHRDIKPANLMRDITGKVKVADLGLARLSDTITNPGATASRLTQVGGILGTASFMSPEQARDSSMIDHRADIYSLGCTLYYLLTAKVPYLGRSVMETVLKHRDAPIPSLCTANSDIPPALDAIYQRMVAKEPCDRFPSMNQVAESLESIEACFGEQARTVDREVATAERSSGPTAEPVDQGPPLKVLLVEPSRAQSAIIRKHLQTEGVQNIIAVASGQEALQAIRSDRPDAVISALHLSDMTGVELALQIHTQSQGETPGFVLISTEEETADAGSLCKCGKEVLLLKPFTSVQLADALRLVSEGARTR
jgi:serine/threonine protein kinase